MHPFLSYKGCFVSVRRRTGIPVFSLSNSWVRFSRKKKSLKIPKSPVTDLTYKFVLGKNQIPNEFTEQVFILALLMMFHIPSFHAMSQFLVFTWTEL